MLPISVQVARAGFKRNPHLRLGQACMNALADIRPEWYRLVTGTPRDPFYQDANLPAFWDFLVMMEDREAREGASSNGRT